MRAHIVCAALGLGLAVGCQPSPGDDPAAERATQAASVAESPRAAAERGDDASFADLSLDGRWVAGGRDRFHLVVDVDGDQAVVTSLSGEVEWEGTYEAEHVEGRYWRLSGGADDAGILLHVFARTHDELEAILFGENGMATARRVYPIPDDLLGEWDVGYSDNYHLSGGKAFIDADAWRVRVGERDARNGVAFGLGERDGTVQLAMRTSSQHTELVNFMRTPNGTWLGWLQGNDQHMVFHPAGARPEWVPPPGARVAAPWLDREPQ